jgi:hypothetical protein
VLLHSKTLTRLLATFALLLGIVTSFNSFGAVFRPAPRPVPHPFEAPRAIPHPVEPVPHPKFPGEGLERLPQLPREKVDLDKLDLDRDRLNSRDQDILRRYLERKDIREDSDLIRPKGDYEHFMTEALKIAGTEKHRKFQLVLSISSDGNFLYVGALSDSFTGAKGLDFGSIPMSRLSEYGLLDFGTDSALPSNARRGLEAAINQKNSTALLINERLLDRKEISLFVGTAKEVYAYDAQSQETYKATKFDTLHPPPKWFAEVEKCCLHSRRPPRLATFRALRQQTFKKSDIEVLSFYSDSKTEKALNSLGTIVTLRSPENLAGTELDINLHNIFRNANGKTLVIIGHVEKGSTFVAEAADGQVLFRIPVSDIQKLADKYNNNLILLGCFTEAALADIGGKAIGTPEALAPSRVVEQLSIALNKSHNWLDFLHNLSAPDLHLVAGDTFLQRMKTMDVDAGNISLLRGQARGTAEWVGEIWLRLKCKMISC